jgi:hypothetical protein
LDVKIKGQTILYDNKKEVKKQTIEKNCWNPNLEEVER